jgi:hypothetical protein
LKLSITTKSAPAFCRAVGRASARGTASAIKAAGLLSLGSVVVASEAFAQAASPTGGIGAQLNSISSEAINSGGEFGGMAMYGASLICFIGGVWALWQSRQPQNRENGRVAMGVAGLVLCGLFATGGVWINKAAVSASGGSASVNDTPTTVQFGSTGG